MNLNTVLKPLRYVWAFPATAIGLCFALLALLSGGKVHRIDGIFEVHGGLVTRLLRIGTPWIKTISALTFGHVVLGQNRECLEQSRSHERIHSKQYEAWGPFFIPLYSIYSLIAALRGLDPYWENPFEKEAYELAGSGSRCSKSSKC